MAQTQSHYTDRWTWRATFAKPRAFEFSDLEKCEKETDAKPEEIDRMLLTMPMISFDWKLPEIALTSVELLERNLSDENSRFSAMKSRIKNKLFKRMRTALEPIILTRETRWISTDPENNTIGKQDVEVVETIFFSETIGGFGIEPNRMVDFVGGRRLARWSLVM